jgi:ABC-2 type transport system permease protein
MSAFEASARQSWLSGWLKWWFVLKMFFQDALAYRATAVIWIMTDVVTAVTMPLVWLASFNGRHQIHGFDPPEMVTYYLVLLALTGLIESHVMWEVATDVKQGKFNIYLVRPFSYMAYMYASNLGWRLMRSLLAIPLFAILACAFHHYLLPLNRFHAGPEFWLAVVLGHFVSFTVSYALGMLSLWLYEARSLYNFYYLPFLIFSGQIAPLALLPAELRNIVQWTPWPYTLSFPVSIFLGRVTPHDMTAGFAGQIIWIGISYLVARLLFRGGLKRFTAFGI